ncbi:Protein of unknown function [Desulfosporosinus lacus DSM 15449]|uniref:Membrane-bound metallopeptidase n=2 Tax=Desulfosporosinus TaxID=79206 RepID=A0A1M5ZRI4_9FIRM|nr:Protein of unknown function [Desulfosporosinus lacus DSM 15449]
MGQPSVLFLPNWTAGRNLAETFDRKFFTLAGLSSYSMKKALKGSAIIMNDLTTNRTPPVIASEINTIKYQTGKFLLTAAIEIGLRLKEAKGLLPYGEWGKWLEESFSYSQQTASKLMRIFEAYGTPQTVSLDAGIQVQELPNLNYTQALILLGIPAEERAEFIAELDVENMSTRELEKAVKDRNQALKERDQALKEKGDLQKTLDDQVNQITQLTTERDKLKTKAVELNQSQREMETKEVQLQSELNSIKKSTSYEDIRMMNKKLNEAQNKACANRVAFLYDSLDRTLKELTAELKNLSAKDPATYEAYRKKVLNFLTKGLKERTQQ